MLQKSMYSLLGSLLGTKIYIYIYIYIYLKSCYICYSEEGHGNPLLYSCLKNPMDGGAWQATVHEIAKSDTTKRLHFHFSLACIGEGNGNPLQCSCLENPRDRGAWWAAIHGVAQSRTRLKRLSSSICVTQILSVYSPNQQFLREVLNSPIMILSLSILFCNSEFLQLFVLEGGYSLHLY